jgi:hypothetical protein
MSTSVDLAFRARLASLLVCTTGSTTLSATAAGYARTAGSFLNDGFAVGMELVPSGFTQTTPALIVGVTALTLTVLGGRTAQKAAAGRTLSVALPSLVTYENGPPFEPVQGRHYVETELLEQPSELLSFPAQGGTREDRGLYVVRWYGVAGTGVLGLGRCVDAVKALFAIGTVFAAGDGSVVRVRGDTGPSASQVQNRPAGFALIAVSIPWRRYAANAITA